MCQSYFLFFKPQHCGKCDDQDEPVYANTFKTEDTQGEEIHYGEIDFSKPALRDLNECPGQYKEQSQCPEYADVRLSCQRARDRHQTAQDAEELYAQVICN